MKQTLVFVLILLALIAITINARGDYIQSPKENAQEVYSLWLKHGNYLHEVDSGRIVYNPEMDKAMQIDIANACRRGGRTPKQCYLNMLYHS
jgi:hypothetical protein